MPRVERWVRVCPNCRSDRIGVGVGGLYDCEHCETRNIKPALVLLTPARDRMAWGSFAAHLAEMVKAQLRSDEQGWLEGSLGEAIANASGMASLEFVTPEQVAEGFAAWLDSTSSTPPQNIGPREGHAVAPDTPIGGTAEGSRIAGPDLVDGGEGQVTLSQIFLACTLASILAAISYLLLLGGVG